MIKMPERKRKRDFNDMYSYFAPTMAVAQKLLLLLYTSVAKIYIIFK